MYQQPILFLDSLRFEPLSKQLMDILLLLRLVLLFLLMKFSNSSREHLAQFFFSVLSESQFSIRI